MTHDCQLVVVIRRDLHWSSETLVIHACHAALGAMEDVTPLELEEWSGNDYKTVVLSCNNEDELVQLETVASMLGISAHLVRGAREATALGLGPCTGLGRVTGTLPLWQSVQSNPAPQVVVH